MSTAFETVMRGKVNGLSIDEDGQFHGYCDSSDELNELLTQLNCIGYSYSVRSSNSNSKNSNATKNSPRFFFSLKKGNVEIKFFGHPFSVEHITYRECILGPRYREKKEVAVPDHLVDHVNPKKKRLCIMDSRKSGCPAKFIVKCIRVYPDYSIQSERAHRDIKRNISESLNKALESSDKPRSFLRYHIVASPPGLHTHCTGSVKVSGDIHPSLANEITRIVKDGTTSVKVIKLHLERFVETNFHTSTTPGHDNIMFYPTDKTIINHVYKALLTMKNTKIDQDALENQINAWEREFTHDKFYFQRCAEEDGKVKPLLFCYQTGWQIEILKKYGSVCLLDATYKTTKYDIPLFFITVKANVCYLVVGFFFVQVENTHSISEALKIFRDWNTGMNPTYWVTDFSESEIKAIEQAFPSAKVYLCSFHREQAWQRWLKKNGNLTEADDKGEILNLWRTIANSSSQEQFRDNLECLRTREVFKRNPRAVTYFENQWVPVSQRWVKAFGDKGIFASINTTNGAEAMNRCVKYSHLKHCTDKTLTGVVMVLVKSYLPSLFQKYCRLNAAVKSYNSEIPKFLHKKTPDFTKHVMMRYMSAEHEFSVDSVSVVDDGLFCVASAVTKECNYIVDFSVPDCTCPDFQKWKYPCKHFCAIFHLFPEWGFERLNVSYRTSPLICLDETFGVGTRNDCSAETSTVMHSLQDATSVVQTNEDYSTSQESISNSALHITSEASVSNSALHTTSEASTSNSALHQQAREMCRHLINLSYNSNTETIKEVIDGLAILQRKVELANPTDNGLPLASTSKD